MDIGEIRLIIVNSVEIEPPTIAIDIHITVINNIEKKKKKKKKKKKNKKKKKI